MTHQEAVNACKVGATVKVNAGPRAGASGVAKRMLVLFGRDHMEIETPERTLNAPIEAISS